MSDGHISILGNRKKVCYKDNITSFPTGRKNRLIQPPTLSANKKGIEWLKDESPSNIINFKCLLPKGDFRIFYLALETLVNKLVKRSGPFFRKNYFEQKYKVFYFHQKSQPIF